MSSWRSAILEHFAPKVAKLTLVSDPDGLLTEEKLVLELRERGFDIIAFNDAIEFRYAYESKYRAVWDRGEHTDLVVILRLRGEEMETLPYDLLQAGRQLSFNLGDIFPNMSYAVIEQLDRGLLDALFNAQQQVNPERMGDNATKDFILRNVFGVAAEIISSKVDMLRFLLRLHYGNVAMPALLADRLVAIFESRGKFKHWNLSHIIPDATRFFAFIQERWSVFLENAVQDGEVMENLPISFSDEESAEFLPFHHEDIKVYIDNLFIEGKLTPVDLPNVYVNEGSWISSGIVLNQENADDVKISQLFGIIDALELSRDARYSDWTAFAVKWAELSSLIHTADSAEYAERYSETGEAWNARFADWLEVHYNSLINLPPSPPAMLHHIPRYLARYIEAQKSDKIALLVMDGLALEQWVTVRNIITQQNSDLVFRESATFAWVPTITSVSRQAIFSGKLPLFFPTSISRTDSDKNLWRQFWLEHGFTKAKIVYERGLGDGDMIAKMEKLINPTQTKVIGLVINIVDEIMHGMKLGAQGMHNQITLWCQKNYLILLLNYLIEFGYDVWITSDHGNIESIGRGRPAEGAIATTRGERVRVYPTPELRSQVAELFTFARKWNPVGLPEGYYPLVAAGNDAFVSEGDSKVSHGGISIEEVIVPFVKVERKGE